MTLSTANFATDHYLKEYQRINNSLTGNHPRWLSKFRQDALEQFSHLGFPTVQNEDWKYTNVAPLFQNPYIRSLNPKNSPDPTFFTQYFLPADLPAHRLVFIDGHFAPALSQIPKNSATCSITNLASHLNENSQHLQSYLNKSLANEHGFIALNNSFIHDGAYIYLSANTELTQPVHLIFITTNQENFCFTPIRNVIVTEKNTRATIIESYISAHHNSHFTNTLTELHIGEHSHVEHYKILEENATSFHFGTLQTNQEAHSHFTAHSFALGGQLVRSDTNCMLSALHCHCYLNGLYLTKDNQHIDHHTFIDHANPHGTSQECYKGVLADRSRAVFNGKVLVKPGANKTVAEQTNKNLLLSKDAEIDTKPQLEIYNDDVRCTHGAAIGQLNEEALFYLCSRGIEKNTARDILIDAFTKEILEKISLPVLKHELQKKITHQFFRG